MASMTGMEILAQQRLAEENILHQHVRFGHLPPPDVLWQMPTLYDDEINAQWRRLMAEQHESQKMARAPTGTVTVPTRYRHNKRLLLCQP